MMTNPPPQATATELLPCPVPWCGGEADADWYAVGQQPRPYWVRCHECGCKTPTQYATVREAVEAWNTRPNQEATITELDAAGEAMMCEGCGTTKTIDAILAQHGPKAIACCPERKMVAARHFWETAKPVQEATRTVGGVVERIEQVAKDMEFAIAGGMSWISHDECVEFVQRLRRIADALSNTSAKPDPEAVIRMELVEALRIIDAAKAHCPFDKEHHPPSSKPCPKCQADSTEPCRKQVLAAFDCVDQVRALLTKATRP